MLVAETCLITAVRNRLRTSLALSDDQCNIELDDQIPAIAKDTHIAVTAAGTTPGERHSSSGGVWDLRFNVRVTVYQRMADQARDRRRNLFIDRLTGLNALVDQVIRAVDFDYSNVLAAAEALLVGTPAAGGNYPEPFRSFSIDTNVKPVFFDPYDAASMPGKGATEVVALSRGVTFQRARFMKERA